MLRRYYAWRRRLVCRLKGHPLVVLLPVSRAWSCPCEAKMETFVEALRRVAAV